MALSIWTVLVWGQLTLTASGIALFLYLRRIHDRAAYAKLELRCERARTALSDAIAERRRESAESGSGEQIASFIEERLEVLSGAEGSESELEKNMIRRAVLQDEISFLQGDSADALDSIIETVEGSADSAPAPAPAPAPATESPEAADASGASESSDAPETAGDELESVTAPDPEQSDDAQAAVDELLAELDDNLAQNADAEQTATASSDSDDDMWSEAWQDQRPALHSLLEELGHGVYTQALKDKCLQLDGLCRQLDMLAGLTTAALELPDAAPGDAENPFQPLRDQLAQLSSSNSDQALDAPLAQFAESLESIITNLPAAGSGEAAEGQLDGDDEEDLKGLLQQFTRDSRDMLECIRNLERENEILQNKLAVAQGTADAA